MLFIQWLMVIGNSLSLLRMFDDISVVWAGLGPSRCVPVSGGSAKTPGALCRLRSWLSATASATAELVYCLSLRLSFQRVQVRGVALPEAFRERALETPCIHQVFADRTSGVCVG